MRSPSRGRPVLIGALLGCAADVRPQIAFAQEPPETPTVTINFPDEMDLQVLVDYVGKTLSVHFLYGEELKNQKVELRPSPLSVPKHELLPLLAGILQVRELAMVEQSPRLYRIVKTEQATRNIMHIQAPEAPAQRESMRLITQILSVPGGDTKIIAEKLAPFTSSAKATVLAVPESNRLIITDYESRIAVLQELAQALAGDAAAVEVRTFSVTTADPLAVASQVSSIVAESQRIQQRSGSPPSIRGDILPGSLVLVGSRQQLDEVQSLIGRLAPPRAELTTLAYAPRYLSVDRLKRLIDRVLLAPGSTTPSPASIFEDTAGARLFITAEKPAHDAIAKLLEREDLPLPETQRPMRVYRPKHRKATELLTTISQLLGQGIEVTLPSAAEVPKDRGAEPPGPNRPPAAPGAGQVPPMPPAAEPRGEEAPPASRSVRVQGSDYTLTADDHTNAILAVGRREFHAQLESLIEDLDKRRPQVLIEMTLVAITISDSMDLGVELEALDLGDAWDYLLFTDFGLSTIDVRTGQRILRPGTGSNGVLIGPDETPFLFRALATRANARVISTPKLLVSDNARGTLRNVDEAPFTSVNASDTVATTSFAGFESAGTSLTVTPHLSEGDYLNLEYELSFSNFTGSSSNAAVPPPRTTNSFTSTVEVPDGYTLITGGLTVDNKTDGKSEVPGLGRIPGLGLLFQGSTKKSTKTKIFAFIRPTILRDDEFEALKFMSLKDMTNAGFGDAKALPGEPLWMR